MSPHMFHLEIYAAALILCVTNLLFTFLRRRFDKKQNIFFIICTAFVSLNCICALINESLSVIKLTSDIAFAVERVTHFVYFLFHIGLAPMFAFYVLFATGSYHRPTKFEQFFWAVPVATAELFLISNPFLHFMYTFDENRLFTRVWGEYIVYVCCGTYFFYTFFKIIFAWKALTNNRRFAILYFFVLVTIGIVVQLFYSDVRSELFMESLGLIGIMISVEAEDDRIDIDTGFYNRRTLQNDINSYLVNRKRFAVICIKVTNADIIQRVTGSQNSDLLSLILAPYLKTLTKRYYIYNATQESFVLTMLDQCEEDIKPLAHQIGERFEQPFSYNDTDILLNAVVITADVPARLHTAADILAMADQPIPKQIVRKVLCGEDLDYLLRRVAVEEAVRRGIEEHFFEVYYQPTYYIDGRLHGAEALIRLHDPVIGSVFPDEFIAVAEQIGMIDQLDNFVYQEVCQFWKTGIPEQNGMDCINVNLSVMHCMQPGFVTQINEIAQNFGIDKTHINFEITESVAASDYNTLSAIVTTLKTEGYHFSMDDYGTGYSNMEAIFALDFDVVKIDKSILWNAEKTEVGRIVLENTVHMVRQMKRRILVEGVETKAQIDLLTKLGVNYLQGYFFSRPVPKDEFIKLIQMGNLLEIRIAEAAEKEAAEKEAAEKKKTAKSEPEKPQNPSPAPEPPAEPEKQETPSPEPAAENKTEEPAPKPQKAKKPFKKKK